MPAPRAPPVCEDLSEMLPGEEAVDAWPRHGCAREGRSLLEMGRRCRVITETTDLARRKTIEELVREWNLAIHEVKRGIETLRAAEARLQCFSTAGTRYDLELFKQHEYSLN